MEISSKAIWGFGRPIFQVLRIFQVSRVSGDPVFSESLSVNYGDTFGKIAKCKLWGHIWKNR